MIQFLIVPILQLAWCSQGTMSVFDMQTCNADSTTCVKVHSDKATRSYFNPLFAFRSADIETFKKLGQSGELKSVQKVKAGHGYFDSQLNILVFETLTNKKNSDYNRELIDLSRL